MVEPLVAYVRCKSLYFSSPPSKPSNFVAANLTSFIHDYRVDIRDGASLSELVENIEPTFFFIWPRRL